MEEEREEEKVIPDDKEAVTKPGREQQLQRGERSAAELSN